MLTLLGPDFSVPICGGLTFRRPTCLAPTLLPPILSEQTSPRPSSPRPTSQKRRTSLRNGSTLLTRTAPRSCRQACSPHPGGSRRSNDGGGAETAFVLEPYRVPPLFRGRNHPLKAGWGSDSGGRTGQQGRCHPLFQQACPRPSRCARSLGQAVTPRPRRPLRVRRKSASHRESCRAARGDRLVRRTPSQNLSGTGGAFKPFGLKPRRAHAKR